MEKQFDVENNAPDVPAPGEHDEQDEHYDLEVQDETAGPDESDEGGESGEKREKAARSSGTRRITKKDQIISLFTSGVDRLEDIALMTSTRTSYVASVLQAAGLISGYFDLYTTSAHPMNTYSRFFAGKLGFKDEEVARRSVALLDRMHRQFAIANDRAGQHHALLMALTMYDRARWTGKTAEAEHFRQWLMARLQDDGPAEPRH